MPMISGFAENKVNKNSAALAKKQWDWMVRAANPHLEGLAHLNARLGASVSIPNQCDVYFR